jgi:glycosyltransferase involved in cell wall biosynthesis
MRNSHKYDICAAVISDLSFDARVWKEARSLASAGRHIALIGTAFDIDGLTRRRDASGVDVCEVPLGWRANGRSRRRRIYALLRVWLEVLSTDASAYHAHDIHIVIPAWLASRLRGARLVYDAHELWFQPYVATLKGRLIAMMSAVLERSMVKTSDGVITTNASRAEVLRKRYGRNDVVVLANVPFLEEDVRPRDPGYPKDKKVILYLGRISAEGRAFRETIEALQFLDDDVHFVVVGFGWESEREAIRRWARDADVAHRVHLLPPLPYDALAGAAAAATVGLVPIYGGAGGPVSETLGDTNKLHEYLMGGLPVVASDLPEIKRVVTSGEPPVGELFDPFSPASIARAVDAVIDDPAYADRRAQARQLARQSFNWRSEEGKLVGLYQSLLDSPPAGEATHALASS